MSHSSCQKLIGFVNGGVTPPSSTHTVVNGDTTTVIPNPQYESWFCTDQLVRSWLFGTLSEEVLEYVHNLQTSREIWVSLAENFNKSSVAREFSLRRNLQLLTKNEKTLAVYCRDFIAIYDSLSSIGKSVDESMRSLGFSMVWEENTIPSLQSYKALLASILMLPSMTLLLRSKVSILSFSPMTNQPQSILMWRSKLREMTSMTATRLDKEEEAGVLMVIIVAEVATLLVEESSHNISPHSQAPMIVVCQICGHIGTYLPITHVGSTTISSSLGTIPLNEVLVCPYIHKSLLSVLNLCDDYLCGVYFDANKVCVIDIKIRKWWQMVHEVMGSTCWRIKDLLPYTLIVIVQLQKLHEIIDLDIQILRFFNN